MSKNIIFCFDGTSNHPNDAKQEREWFGLGQIEDNGITNILKLHVLFGGNLSNTASSNQQHSFYYSGVGTYGNKFQQLFNATFAPNNQDVGKIIRLAGQDLEKIYEKTDKIFIFGFSRGAAIARRFSSVINNYIDLKKGTKPIEFIGIFDTVASIGFPNLDSSEKPISDVVFENYAISPYIKKALHILALDENRIVFQPTLMHEEKRVTEVWFPGSHSDIGGGFWYDGLSDVTLKFMIDEIKRQFNINILPESDVDYDQLKKSNYEIDHEDVYVKPNHAGKHHPHDRWYPIAKVTLATREVRAEEKNNNPQTIPLLHPSVIDRIKDVIGYRPKALKGIKHQLWSLGDKKTYAGIKDHI